MIRGPVLACVLGTLPALSAVAQPAPVPAASPEPYLHDRGTGVPTSMFGTYIRGGEWIVYPFFEYYRDGDFEYKPEELGFAGDLDFRARYRAKEGLVLLAYGLTDDLAIELEAAVISASLEKSPDDRSALPARIEESGLGDVEGQIRWRWRRETRERPEFFSYMETVIPHAKDKPLTGTPDLELKLGTGLVRGFSWGTLTLRAAIQYSGGSTSQFDLGEYAVEYLKRVSPRFSLYAGLEGTQDELSLIAEAQWRLGRNVTLKVNSGLGITSKATDWAPEAGVLFRFPKR